MDQAPAGLEGERGHHGRSPERTRSGSEGGRKGHKRENFEGRGKVEVSNGWEGRSGGHHHEESDEEGEVKEAGWMPRDLRDVLRGKRGLDKDKKKVHGQTRNESKVNAPAEGIPRGSRSGHSSPRSDAGGGPRKEETLRRAPEGGRGGGFLQRENSAGRRRGSSPPLYRSNRDVPPVGGVARRSSPPQQLTRRGLMEERGATFGGTRSRSRERLERRSSPSPRSFRRGDVGGGRFSPEPVRGPSNCVVHLMNLPPGLSVDRVRAELHRECDRFGRVADMKLYFQGKEREAYITFSDPGTAETARRGMNRFVLLGSEIEAEIEGDRGGGAMRMAGGGRAGSPPLIRRQPVPDRYDIPPGEGRRRPPELFEELRDSVDRRRGPDDWEGPRGGRGRGEPFGGDDLHGGRRPPSDPGFLEGRRRPPDPAFDDMHDPNATCRVCVDDLDEGIGEGDVLTAFKPFGYIESVELERFRARAMAFIKFRALSSAVRARREMDGQRIGGQRVKVDYAMGKPSPNLWVGSVHASVGEAEIGRRFSRFGRVVEVNVNRQGKCAYVMFESVEDAEAAAREMRGATLTPSSWRIKVDFTEGRGASSGGGSKMLYGAGGAGRVRESSLTRRSRSPLPARGSSIPRERERGEGGPHRLVLVLDREVSQKALHNHFSRYGRIVDIEMDMVRGRAAIFFARKESATDAAADPEGPRMGAALGVIDVELDEMTVAVQPERLKRRRDEDRGGGMYEDDAGYDKRQNLGSGAYSQSSSVPSNGGYDAHHPADVGYDVGGARADVGYDVGGARADVGYDVGGARADVGYDVGGARADVGHRGDAMPQAPISSGHSIPSVAPGSVNFGAPVPLSLAERLEQRFPALWTGSLVLKNAGAGMSLHRISGEGSLKSTLPEDTITITQRMRLEADKIMQFGVRLKEQDRPSVLIAVAPPGSEGDFQAQFVSYLRDRNVAGVVQTPTGYMLYLFPPGKVALEFIAHSCGSLDMSQEEGYLLAIVISAQ